MTKDQVNGVYNKLTEMIEAKVDKNTLDNIKSLLNYSKENEFRSLNVLVEALKSSDESSKSVECITILNNMQMFVEYYTSCQELPIFTDTNGETLTLGNLIQNILDSDIRVFHAEGLQTITNRLIKTPLKWGRKSLNDYFKVDLGTGEIWHDTTKQ